MFNATRREYEERNKMVEHIIAAMKEPAKPVTNSHTDSVPNSLDFVNSRISSFDDDDTPSSDTSFISDEGDESPELYCVQERFRQVEQQMIDDIEQLDLDFRRACLNAHANLKNQWMKMRKQATNRSTLAKGITYDPEPLRLVREALQYVSASVRPHEAVSAELVPCVPDVTYPAGQIERLVLQTLDADGGCLENGGAQLSATLAACDGSFSHRCSVEDMDDGTYCVTLPALQPVSMRLQILLWDEKINELPVKVSKRTGKASRIPKLAQKESHEKKETIHRKVENNKTFEIGDLTKQTSLDSGCYFGMDRTLETDEGNKRPNTQDGSEELNKVDKAGRIVNVTGDNAEIFRWLEKCEPYNTESPLDCPASPVTRPVHQASFFDSITLCPIGLAATGD